MRFDITCSHKSWSWMTNPHLEKSPATIQSVPGMSTIPTQTCWNVASVTLVIIVLVVPPHASLVWLIGSTNQQDRNCQVEHWPVHKPHCWAFILPSAQSATPHEVFDFKGVQPQPPRVRMSAPVGLQTFKIETQIHVSNKVQVTQICRSSTCENTSTCYLIKKSDTNRIWTNRFMTSDALDHWAICT